MIMASLNHERVVKLLGVIMEDRDCSLVMELIPRGNLLVMLETVSRFTICGRNKRWSSPASLHPCDCPPVSVEALTHTNSPFLGPRAPLHQGPNHFRDFGSDGVPHRTARYSQRHQTRKYSCGQGFSHQGTVDTMASHACSVMVIWWYSFLLFLDCRSRPGHMPNMEQTHKGGVPQKKSEGAHSWVERCRHAELHGSWAPGERPHSLHWEIGRLQLCYCNLGHPHGERAVCK